LTDTIKEFWTFKLVFFAPDGSNLSSFCRLCSRSLYVNPSASPLLIISFSIGCALSAPDGSSPRGYVWILVDKHSLKIHLFFLLLTSTVSKPPSPSRGFLYRATTISSSCFFFFFFFFGIIVCSMQNFNSCCKICLRALF
jgi:hypothetical protein